MTMARKLICMQANGTLFGDCQIVKSLKLDTSLCSGCSLVPRPSITANAVEGLVKLLCRMMSGGRLEAWHFQ